MSQRTWSRRIALVGLALLLGACATSQPPQAAETESPLDLCYEGAATRLEVAPCLEKMLAKAETELDHTQRRARKELGNLAKVTGRRDVLREFDESQRAFIRYRDAQCRFVEAQAEPGTGAGDMRLDCMIRLTRLRLREVQAILE